MAQLKGLPALTGSLSGLSAYKMRGIDGIVVRMKGGPTKQQIKKNPAYDITRRRNMERRGCMQMLKQVKRQYTPCGIFMIITAPAAWVLCKSILEEDTAGEFGKRSVLVSKAGYQLEGFTLNKYHPFDTVLRHPLNFSVNRQNEHYSINSAGTGTGAAAH